MHPVASRASRAYCQISGQDSKYTANNGPDSSTRPHDDYSIHMQEWQTLTPLHRYSPSRNVRSVGMDAPSFS